MGADLKGKCGSPTTPQGVYFGSDSFNGHKGSTSTDVVHPSHVCISSNGVDLSVGENVRED